MNRDFSGVRVRFAPSPTGHLHVGGARTALFNFLFAKNHEGKFLLRIEDTDKKRSETGLTDEILRSLQWLGLKWDEETVYQSTRIEEYSANALKLLETGHAYRCFCKPEELDIKRKKAQKEKRQYKYDKTCRHLDEGEINNRIDSGIEFSLRFSTPEEGTTGLNDLVYGEIEFKNSEIDDFIIVRRDGTPTYQLAVVTDDSEMGITHVIRGDDHLSNTPKQINIFNALGLDIPVYAHLPMIMGADGKRLSKRHGAASVIDFQKEGIFPEALLNHLALLGWSPKDDTELMSIDELIRRFQIEQVSRKNAIFDYKKLLWMNGQHLSSKPTDELILILRKKWETSDGRDKSYYAKVAEIVKTRANSTSELLEFSAYFFEDPKKYDEKAMRKYWSGEDVNERIRLLKESLDDLTEFSEENLEGIVRSEADSLDIKAALLIHPVRLALTGYGVSPGLFVIMELLGKSVVIRRLDNALKNLPQD
ncbi:MAG: glutamate--tRNA ligase [Candidatus Marinimicrobia bacterium]|nr:glutamate--tRNA ligase [Candidatus Neomarinimicrobiota bacterium]